jgi:hypothetical protein
MINKEEGKKLRFIKGVTGGLSSSDTCVMPIHNSSIGEPLISWPVGEDKILWPKKD